MNEDEYAARRRRSIVGRSVWEVLAIPILGVSIHAQAWGAAVLLAFVLGVVSTTLLLDLLDL